jgi:hypothetical protein
MAPETFKTTTTVVLTGPDDWDLWLSDIRRIAKVHDIWDVINPDATPETTLEEPARPTSEGKFGQSLEDLTAGQQLACKNYIDTYKQDLEKYNRKKKALANLESRIGSTVNSKCLRIIQKLSTAKEILSRLQERIAPTDYAREIDSARSTSRSNAIMIFLNGSIDT